MIPEAEHEIALRLEPSIALSVSHQAPRGVVLPAIDLDDEPGAMTGEVGDTSS
jgi:hypothetical protein